jgi:kynurenine formamidase
MKSHLLAAALLFPLLAGCRVESSGPESFPVVSFPDGRLVDLTHPFNAETIYWPTAEGFQLAVGFDGTTEGGYHYAANSFFTAEHGGTHLDAPVHFGAGRQTADQVPLERLIGPAILVDVSPQSAADRDYQVSVQDFEAWERLHGRIPDGAIVLLRTGFGRFWPDRERYMGTAARGPEAVAGLHFPGLHPEAARWLTKHRVVHAIGLDTPSIDFGQSTQFQSHRILAEHDVPVFENLASLDDLPETGFSVIALPMKIEGGSGGPLRAVAVVP